MLVADTKSKNWRCRLTLRLCGGKDCKHKKRRAVYLVNRQPMCTRCLEAFLDLHGCENYSLYRLTEREEDYSEKTHLRPSRETQVAHA